MVQLAAEVRQRLGVARFGPQRAGDALTRNRRAAVMKNQKSNELLLPRGWQTSYGATVCKETEASKQLDAEGGPGHRFRLHRDSGPCA